MLKWDVKEILKFENQFRAKCELFISDKSIVVLWITIKKHKDEKLSIVKADNWELKNDSINLLLINKLKEIINENK